MEAVTKWLGMPWPVTILVFVAIAIGAVWLWGHRRG